MLLNKVYGSDVQLSVTLGSLVSIGFHLTVYQFLRSRLNFGPEASRIML